MAANHSFGPFYLDARDGILFKGSEPLALGQRAVALLRVLLERSGAPVSKDDLIDVAWPGLAVEGSNLPVQIAALRRALSVEAGGENWIETLPRRGYRYIGPTAIEIQSAEDCTLKKNPALTGAQSTSTRPRLSIVVLPFTSMGSDTEQDYFVDAVTESLTTDLSRINGSFVIARNSAFSYKGKTMDARQVGRELNIRYVLEGSVQRSGNRLRVNVQLIDAETGNNLWAERFDKPVADLFDVQDEIVSRLANELGTELMLAEAKRAERVLNPDAIELCYQGAASIYKGHTHENLGRARGFFERALSIDPNCIEALLGKARVELGFGSTFVDETRWAHFAAAEPLLAKVLALAPNNALAHALLGIAQMHTRRVEAGIAQCERALALNRNLATAWGMIGYGKQLIGRADQTERHVKEAERLSPRDAFAFRWLNNAGVSKLLLADDAAAVSWLRRCVEANRNYSISHLHLAAALGLSGEVEEARTAGRAGLALDPKFTIRNYRLGAASENATYLAGRERIYQGMRIAGLPEG